MCLALGEIFKEIGSELGLWASYMYSYILCSIHVYVGQGDVINVAITKCIYCIGIFMYILRCVGRCYGTCDMGNMLSFRRLLTTRQLHYPQVGFCWSSQQSPPFICMPNIFEFDNTLFVIQSRKAYVHTKIWHKQLPTTRIKCTRQRYNVHT